MRSGSGSERETLVVINGHPYTLRVIDQPRDLAGQPCKSFLDRDTKEFFVMSTIPLWEWLGILAKAVNLPDGPVIWNALPVALLGA